MVDYSARLERISTLLMAAGRSAPRYEKMALLYPRSKTLQSYLSEYFIVIVHLCHQLLKSTKQSTLKRLVSFPSESELNKYQSEMSSWGGLIKDEVGLLMNQNLEEQGSRVRTLLGFSEAELSRQRARVRIRVLDFCSTYDYQTTWREIRKAGNTTLLGRMPDYQDWKTRTNSCTLICTGKLGSGKSVLLANIVDDLNLHVQHADCPVTYFFCRHDIAESLNANTIIGSLARQFLRPIADISMAENAMNQTTMMLNAYAIQDILRRVLPPSFKAYVVLDGLDECDGNQRRAVIEHFRKLQDQPRPIFRTVCCVDSRRQP